MAKHKDFVACNGGEICEDFCGEEEERSGGWWHGDCGLSNLNGLYNRPNEDYTAKRSMFWCTGFSAAGSTCEHVTYVSQSQMRIRNEKLQHENC